MKILFTGDSVTDAGRNTNSGCPLSLGQGYAFLIAARLMADAPRAYECINTGVSGNRSVDLYARIKSDVWQHDPDLISIMIGVNDVWHELVNHNGVEPDRFEQVYRLILSDTLKQNSHTGIVLLKPFVLDGLKTHDQFDAFSRDVHVRGEIVDRLAGEFGLEVLDLQVVFDQALEKAESSHWLWDGVHPSPAGHQLIADAWLKTFRHLLNQ